MDKAKPKTREYKVGDEISYALASGIRYGTVVRVLGDVVEVEYEDGKKEMKKVADSRLRPLRRRSDEDTRPRSYNQDIAEVRRSETRRR
jgi:predicted type IV restriction endonuclease